MKRFANGFTSWQETHYEVVQAITKELTKVDTENIVLQIYDEQGHGGLYELAEELTDEFEETNIGRQWSGDFFDEIDSFLNNKKLS